MKKYVLFAVLLLCGLSKAFATWSIIVIDPETKAIGIAGASCTPNCYGIGSIVPGMGAIIVQAMSNSAARKAGMEMIVAEASPETIVRALRDPQYDPERQQYAVVTIKFLQQPATYTGDSTHPFNGTLTAPGVSVQGNTLANEEALRQIMNALIKGQVAKLSLPEILMIALEAGGLAGGDKRCGDQRATSAFLMVAMPDDKRPSVNLSIFNQPKGGQNAVTMLRAKLERWKSKHPQL
ncbi:DUF1028 domain-containing protein [Flavihumibacter petaseus]|uniref:DUF1028 domain-containing protein n=1 Tax=Flavihumibacter petaseus NBRC 106054 TaxID=1220578 RepID=A0A0E9MY45_9BACT|nr:DUF1028 domain-containing protein [Flavihumibacter petaseus]GAO42504.1 hypothetical protein FPE01S_01_15180 [Flavihumibacter petaseus NBRC 106054]